MKRSHNLWLTTVRVARSLSISRCLSSSPCRSCSRRVSLSLSSTLSRCSPSPYIFSYCGELPHPPIFGKLSCIVLMCRVGRFRIFNNPPIARWPYPLIMEIYGFKPYIYGIGQPYLCGIKLFWAIESNASPIFSDDITIGCYFILISQDSVTRNATASSHHT